MTHRHDFVVEHLEALVEVAARHGEGKVRGAVQTVVLNDHVHIDVVVGHRAENLIGNARGVGNACERDLGFVAGAGNAGNKGFLHFRIILKRNQSAARRFNVNGKIGVGQAREHAHGHAVLACEFNAADLQDLRAQAREFQHLFKADDVEAPRLGLNARVGRVHAVDVGKDQAFLRLEGHR